MDSGVCFLDTFYSFLKETTSGEKIFININEK